VNPKCPYHDTVTPARATMSTLESLKDLAKHQLSSDTKILSDPQDAAFHESMMRWTDVDKKQPCAVVMPATEDDIVKLVRTQLIDPSIPPRLVPTQTSHQCPRKKKWSQI